MLLVHARNLAVLTFGTLLAVSLTASSAHASGRAEASGMATVAGGTVTGIDGAAMPGTAVDLYAWPSDAVLKAMKPGQLVPTTLLTTATTNNAGEYTLDVPSSRLRAAAVEAGYANLEIFSAASGFWFMSYQTGSLAPEAPATVNLSGKSSTNCGLLKGRPYNFTGLKFQHAKKTAWAIVGQGYILPQKKTAGDTLSFVYTKGANHEQATSLGVGISGAGFDTGYTTEGENASTVKQSETYGAAHTSTWFRTKFNVGQFRGLCFGPENDSNVPRKPQNGNCPRSFTNAQHAIFYVHKCIWEVKSTGWFGGQNTQHPKAAPKTPARFCAPHEATDQFDSDFGKAIKWSKGFDMGADLGYKGAHGKANYDSSAETGYDSDALMSFKFKHNGFLCGTDHSEAKAALLVQRSNLP